MDVAVTGLQTPPTSNNTCLVDNSDYSDEQFTQWAGEDDSTLDYDTAGSEITGLDGTFQSFKVAGTATEYFLAYINNGSSELIKAKRGNYFDSSGDPINRAGISDNDTITLMKTVYLFITKTGSVQITYNRPTTGASAPSSPANGDFWYDSANDIWKKYDSSSFVDSESTYIGLAIIDENGNCVGARAEDFHKDLSELNTYDMEYLSATEFRSVKNENTINVYGTVLKTKNDFETFDITADLEDGQSEAASTYYYGYIKENGGKVLSNIKPHNRSGDLLGYYHPHETWRFVARIYNDSSSDIESTSVENSFENFRDYEEFVNLTTTTNSVTANTYKDVTGATVTVNPGKHKLGFSVVAGIKDSTGGGGTYFGNVAIANSTSVAIVGDSISMQANTVMNNNQQDISELRKEIEVTVFKRTTFRLRMRCNADAANGVFTIHGSTTGITAGLTNTDGHSTLYTRRVRNP